MSSISPIRILTQCGVSCHNDWVSIRLEANAFLHYGKNYGLYIGTRLRSRKPQWIKTLLDVSLGSLLIIWHRLWALF